jgi:hypothetical protein
LVLSIHDRKELESIIKAATNDSKTLADLARKMIPRQGNVEEFAYGLICGLVLGNFIERFTKINERQPDRDEMADLFLIMMRRRPAVRKAIMGEFESI